MKIAIIEAKYYKEITDMLYKGASEFLDSKKIKHDRFDVDGAFELPLAMSMAIESAKYDGVIALGCVIRGETTHYDFVCSECASGLATLSRDLLMPLGFGVLTVENKEQAIVRAGEKNKGEEAAKACVNMVKMRDVLL